MGATINYLQDHVSVTWSEQTATAAMGSVTFL